MGISTKLNEKQKAILSKREKIDQLKEKHKALFKQEEVKDPKFIPKMCYKNNGELVISFYPSEVRGGLDIYTEFVSREYISEDPDRRLWKWIYNAEFNTEYQQSDPHPTTGDRRYLIPIDELIEIKAEEKDIFFKDVVMLDGNADIPYNAMTLRDYAAIQWKLPVSHKTWLNDLIKSLRK